MGFVKEFRDFAMKGNVVDMAVGIIIGAAFGKIVQSFVKDILMPPIGHFLGGADFSDLFILLGEGSYESLAAADEAGAAVIRYGQFLTIVIDFIIVAFAIFVAIKIMNSAKKRFEKQEEAAPKTPPKQEVLLEEIRDQLVELNKN